MLALFFCVVAVNAAPAVSSKKDFLEPNDMSTKATEEAQAVAMEALKKTAEEKFEQRTKALHEAKVADKKSSEMVGAAKFAADTAKTEFSGVLRKLASAAGAAANKAAIEKAERAVMERTAAEKAAEKTRTLNDVKADMKKIIAKAEAAQIAAEEAKAELAAAAAAKAKSAETAAEKAHAAEVAKDKEADVASGKAAEYEADVATPQAENKPPNLRMAENSAQALEYAAEYAAEGGAAEYIAEDGAAAEGEAAEYAAEAERAAASQLTDDDEGSAKEEQSKMAEVSAKGDEEIQKKMAEVSANEEEIQRMLSMTGEYAAEGGAESDESQKDVGDDSDDAADDGEDGLYQEDISNDDGQLDAPDDGTTSDGVGVSMAQISSSDDDFQNDDFLTEIQHGDNFQTGCVSFSKALVAHSSGNKKKVNSQMELVCSSLKFAVDVDMCQRYQSTIMGHLHKKAAWNMNSMDYTLFCKGMIKVKAEQTKELEAAQVAAKKYNAALKAGIAGIAVVPAPAPLLVKASLKEVSH